mmetsp:Transcript_4944/g.10905  ORF Transcript_4944/g.10905 Transcript_4944/m.10905 type:complete len:452 (-) Transcript_4944:1713-3068(-)
MPSRRLPRRRSTTAQRGEVAGPISPFVSPSSRHRAHRTRLQSLVPLERIAVRPHQRQAVHQLRRHIIRKRTPNPAHLLVHEAHAQYVPGPQRHAFHGAEGGEDRVLVEHLLLGAVIPQSRAEEGEVGLGFVDGIHDGLEGRLDVHGDEVVLLEFLAAMIVVVIVVVVCMGGCGVFLPAVVVVVFVVVAIASGSASSSTPPPPPQCTPGNPPSLLLLLIPFDPGQRAGQRRRQSQQQQVGPVLADDHAGRVGGMRSQDVGIAVLLGPRPVLVGQGFVGIPSFVVVVFFVVVVVVLDGECCLLLLFLLGVVFVVVVVVVFVHDLILVVRIVVVFFLLVFFLQVVLIVFIIIITRMYHIIVGIILFSNTTIAISISIIIVVVIVHVLFVLHPSSLLSIPIGKTTSRGHASPSDVLEDNLLSHGHHVDVVHELMQSVVIRLGAQPPQSIDVAAVQ